MKNDKKLEKRLTLKTQTIQVLDPKELGRAHGGAGDSMSISCNKGGRCSFIYCPA